jgi:hypothetical protein
MSLPPLLQDKRTCDYAYCLEARLKERSEELETVHMMAAIDAGLTDVSNKREDNPIVIPSIPYEKNDTNRPKFIFDGDDHFFNPNAVANCLSPFEPSSADRIETFCQWVDLKPTDVLLDIGSGDGRVCIAASKMTGK